MRITTLAIAVAGLSLAVPTVGRAIDGALVYQTRCAKCHGDTGKADTPIAKPLKVPALAGDQKIAATAPAEIAKMIKENPKHATFVSKLSTEDLDAVAAYVKGLAAAK